MNTLLATTKNFYLYQKKRFPIIILGLSFLPAILSSGTVVATEVGPKFILISLVVSLAYLLHVRIIDEFRDYEHDALHHTERPLPAGTITLNELRSIDWLAITVVMVAALYSSLQALFIAVAMLLYSFFARNEFFFGLQFKKHFYLYNAINLVQMLLLQVFVYSIASNSFSFNTLIIVHFLFTATGTVIFEFLRKVKSPGLDGTGQDTYTWFLGFTNALCIYSVFAALNILLFFKVLFQMEHAMQYGIPIAIALIASALSTLFLNMVKRTEKTNQLMQLSFMVMYGSFNILIFLSA